MKTTKAQQDFTEFEHIDQEQLPIADHKLQGWKHFAGLYAAEHVAATEFVIGATFVALGAKTMDIVIGLLIGNLLAILSWALICAPIAVDTRLSLYNYLNKIGGNSMSKLYNWANVLIFTVISAAMITVSSTGIRYVFDIPAQLNWYPTNLWFVLIVFVVGAFAVTVAIYGFKAVSNFSGIAAPWLFTMFATGAMVLIPELSLEVLNLTLPNSFSDLIQIGDQAIWTGVNQDGDSGIGLAEVIGFAWAANSITHFGLIDMILFRYAKKPSDALATSTGMLFGHYIAWISSGLMGAGTGLIVGKTIGQLDPGDVAFHALGWSGFIIVIVAGWTTAITNLYRAGMAAQAVFPRYSGRKTTLAVGVVMVIVAAFPFVFTQILGLLTYAGLVVVPVGAIVFAEHVLFPRIGFTRYWCKYQDYVGSKAAIISWVVGLAFGFGLDALQVMPFYYLFIPTWIFTIALYTILAGSMGAKKSFAAEAKAEAKYIERIKAYQTQQSNVETVVSRPDNALTRVLRLVALASLAITFILAGKVLFGSIDRSAYVDNRELFYSGAFICTLVYFVLATWVFRRRQA